MPKLRIIANVCVFNGRVVQTYQYSNYKFVGSLSIVLSELNKYGVDEILLVDLDAAIKGESRILEDLPEISKNVFVPLTYSGGISTIEKAKIAFASGADRVAINTHLFDSRLIDELTKIYGKQAVIGVIDIWINNEETRNYDYRTRETFKIHEGFINKLNELEVGQLLFNIVSHSGCYNGYGLDGVLQLMREIKLGVPILIGGGFGHSKHIQEVLDMGINLSGFSIGNRLFHIEHSVAIIKEAFPDRLIRNVREASYQHHKLDSNGRLLKLDDSVLNGMLFENLKDDSVI